MTRRRAFTDEQCRELADWYAKVQAIPRPMQKARELGVTWATLKDAIRRGNGLKPMHTERKVASYLAEMGIVPRETETSS